MTGRPEPTVSRTLITVLAAALAALVVGAGVVVVVRGSGSGSEPPAVEVSPSAAGTSVVSPRMSWIVPRPYGPEGAGVLEVTGPECDSAVINADLLFPNSGARIIDCQAGWAVMASAVSGDPYWVAYSDGRWRRAPDVSIHLGTCPAEAIAKGAPAWMAQKHLTSCAPSERPGPAAPTPTPSPARTSPATTSARPPAAPTRTSSRTRAPVEDAASPVTSPRQTSVATPTSPPTSVVTTSPSPTSESTPSTAADDAPGPDGE